MLTSLFVSSRRFQAMMRMTILINVFIINYCLIFKLELKRMNLIVLAISSATSYAFIGYQGGNMFYILCGFRLWKQHYLGWLFSIY